MASLWKRENSKYFICCYDTADGRRLKKSTKQTERTKAQVVCAEIERVEQLAGSGSLTERTVRNILGGILERTTGEQLTQHRAGPWLDDWLAMKKESREEGTAKVYRTTIGNFKASLGERVNVPLSAIVPRDILNYRKGLIATGRSPKTANHSVACLSVAFNAAVRQGVIPSNPCLAVERLPEETLSRDSFTAEQVRALIKAAEGDWPLAIAFGYYTGARLSDIANMRWNAIDLVAQTITFRPKKTKRKIRQVVIPIHPNLEAMLLKAPGVGAAPVFPSLVGVATGWHSGLSNQFAAVMVKAGIEGVKRRHGDNGRLLSTLSFHSLRHSMNSELANAGVAQELRMKLTGHTRAATNATYTHHEAAVLRAAVEKMPGV